MTLRVIVLAALFLGGDALAGSPSCADWLVMRDGTRVETAGAWKTEGRQVVFKRPDGQLSSLRLADVDLEASLGANAEVAIAEPAVPSSEDPSDWPGHKKPVKRFTNKDLPPVEPDPEAGTEADASGEKEGDGPIRVVSWEVVSRADRGLVDPDRLEIVGSVRNSAEAMVALIRLKVTALDHENKPVVSVAFLERSSLAPGQTSAFRAFLPGISSLREDPTFEATGENFTITLDPGSAQRDEEEIEEPQDRPSSGESGL